MTEPHNPAPFTPASQAWLFTPSLQRLFAVFAAAGAEARVVGGAVRNSLLGAPVGDIDLAVNRAPEEAEAILLRTGIKVVRTGFVHGTITAVLDGQGYEVTSLRRDVTTDGRRATVAYTDGWAEDAARRDFTCNALYVDAAGRISDFHAGYDDALAGRIRFIGDPAARIAEDYLRILRFFRLHAWYGRGAFDADGLAACAAAAPFLATLSRERVTQEWRKLLLAPQPVPVLAVMEEQEILGQVVPLTLALPRLTALLALPAGATTGFALRFAALLPFSERLLTPVLETALRLSKAELQQVLALGRADLAIAPANLSAILYRYGTDYARNRVLLQAAGGAELAALLARIAAWTAPRFPLSGQDGLALGLTPSPALGALLQAVEDWWLAADCAPDRAACLTELRRRHTAR